MMMMQMLAQYESSSSGGPPAAFFAAFAAVFCGALLVSLAIQAVICYIVISLFKRVPVEYRKQNPNLVWLMLIPLFNLVWSFFVYPKLSQSYEAWGQAVGRTDVGNAFGGMALALCICMCCCIVPYLNACAGIAVLVLLIIYLVKINGLKEKLGGGVIVSPGGPAV